MVVMQGIVMSRQTRKSVFENMGTVLFRNSSGAGMP